MSEKWVYSNNEESWNISEEYDSREGAIENGIEDALENDWTNLFIAKAKYIVPKIKIDASRVIEDTAEQIDCEYGATELELGTLFIEDIGNNEVKQLQQMLDEATQKWLEKINYNPYMFICEGIEQIDLPEAKEESE